MVQHRRNSYTTKSQPTDFISATKHHCDRLAGFKEEKKERVRDDVFESEAQFSRMTS